MNYERFTERLENGGVKITSGENWSVLYPQNYEGYNAKAKMLLRLAEYEDKIEDGTLIELPCIAYNAKRRRYQVISSKNGRIFASKFYTNREYAEQRLKWLKQGGVCTIIIDEVDEKKEKKNDYSD